MKNKFLLTWYFRRKNFIKILAFNKINDNSLEDLRVWSFFQLGMYVSVLKREGNLKKWRTLFAKIISNAQLGKYKEAKGLLDDVVSCKACHKNISILIMGLSPFMPKEAFFLHKKYNQPLILLEIGLLLKLGEERMALEKLEFQMKSHSYRKNPETLLFYSNIKDNTLPKERLVLLNKFLLQYNLSSVKLKEEKLSLCVKNMTSLIDNTYIGETLVSVIMTTYNSENTIKSALNSLVEQSYINLEIIIVDDASEDQTVSIIKEFMRLDERIKLISLSKNVGTYVAKNIALDVAKGEFITCHDSDDFSHPSKIEIQVVPLLKNKKLVSTISYWVRLDDDGKYYARQIFPLLRLNLSSLMFRKKEVYNKIGIYDSVRTGADSEFFARINLVFGKKRVYKIKKPLSFGAHRKNSLMTAKATGYNNEGLSNSRLDYWEAWNQWHINKTASNIVPYVAVNMDLRKEFSVPSELVVDRKEIDYVYNTFIL